MYTVMLFVFLYLSPESLKIIPLLVLLCLFTYFYEKQELETPISTSFENLNALIKFKIFPYLEAMTTFTWEKYAKHVSLNAIPIFFPI